MKWYIVTDKGIVPLNKSNYDKSKGNITGKEALRLAKDYHMRLPWIHEVIKKMKTSRILKEILIKGWIWTREEYDGCLSRLDLRRDLDLFSSWLDLAYSNSDGRVVMVCD
jgi:hypothetical protein